MYIQPTLHHFTRLRIRPEQTLVLRHRIDILTARRERKSTTGFFARSRNPYFLIQLGTRYLPLPLLLLIPMLSFAVRRSSAGLFGGWTSRDRSRGRRAGCVLVIVDQLDLAADQTHSEQVVSSAGWNERSRRQSLVECPCWYSDVAIEREPPFLGVYMCVCMVVKEAFLGV